MSSHIEKTLCFITSNYFAGLYLEGQEFNFNIFKINSYINPAKDVVDLYVYGYILGKYQYSFNSSCDKLTMNSYYSANAPDGRKFFDCIVNNFFIREPDKDTIYKPDNIVKSQEWSYVVANVGLRMLSFYSGPLSSLDNTNFKFKEGSQPIGDSRLSVQSVVFNRASLFDWED